MKTRKRITAAISIITVLIAVAAIGSISLSQTPLNEISTVATTSTAPSTTSTTAPSTTSTTSSTTAVTTSSTTESKKAETTGTTAPRISLDSLSVIDLYPLSLSGGDWDVKHCQGIAVDEDSGYIWYSYTTMLVKCSFDGKIVASVTGVPGHMGDITYNKADTKIYCGHYSSGRTGFYILIFDTTKITKMNMKPTKDIVRSVYVKEAYEDYLFTHKIENEDGTVTELPHRYGCSGIDGVTMGPDFMKKSKKELLTVAYGTYAEKSRKDNNYQVLLQYDVTGWWNDFGQDISQTAHRSGPAECGKFFVFTGNTTWGTQTMEYFDELNIWVLNCYKGVKESYNKYTLFAVDGDIKPKKQKLKGQPEADRQYVLSLYTDGSYDAKHNIWGWYSDYGVQGVAYVRDGLFYVCQPYKSWTGKKLAICYLNVWKTNKNGNGPFTLSVNVSNDYSISKAKHIVITTTKPLTTAASAGDETSSKSIIDQIMDYFG